MTESSRLFLFPDINVWVALTYEGHIHHRRARAWFDEIGSTARLFFCRFTQLGLLRLLSAEAVMGRDDVMSQAGAWQAYDRWIRDERIKFLPEPDDLETHFRRFSQLPHPSPKDWGDSYLGALAAAAHLTLVTFDKALPKTSQIVLLSPAR